jgi:dihydropyrimidinase
MTDRGADYLIRGGLVVRGTGITREDIAVADGKIIEHDGSYADTAIGRIIDATGMFVMPGIVDAHNHPVNADRIETFSLSAAFGGVTTVVPFIQNMRRQGIEGTVTDMIDEFMDEAAADSYLDYAIHAILLGDDDVDDQVPKLMDMGVISFKMYMTYPRRGMMMPDDRMLRAMEMAAADGGIAMVHAENGYCIDHLVERSIEAGHTGREHYAPSQPRILEIEAAHRAATYAKVTGCPLYIVHLSAREILDVLEQHRGDEMHLFGETCPQYLDLTNQAMLDHGALAKIGPPLRERVDNEAMWRGLSSHLIDTIASDFCGFRKSQKASYDSEGEPGEEGSIFDATFGGNWVEQMLCVAYHEGVNMGRITLPRLVQVMCENPAKIFGLYPQKGSLDPGADADIVLFDPSVQHTLSAETQHCNADYTMFEGKRVTGKPVMTMQRGEILVENGVMQRPKGRARYLPGNRDLTAYAESGYAVS